jgi:hypothetical protein
MSKGTESRKKQPLPRNEYKVTYGDDDDDVDDDDDDDDYDDDDNNNIPKISRDKNFQR